jgi:hypothetical protein
MLQLVLASYGYSTSKNRYRRNVVYLDCVISPKLYGNKEALYTIAKSKCKVTVGGPIV